MIPFIATFHPAFSHFWNFNRCSHEHSVFLEEAAFGKVWFKMVALLIALRNRLPSSSSGSLPSQHPALKAY